ncbi:MgtC/SapB family protein [Sandarakinorhabdus limnophila]|uniref:MgtC/SapB family protein n=1 Tax=Sandarakinorhabdus limnophila TaxID=210512 RepID=UPI0026E94655|nr:DUF4010 domain-containing protein [Sandarakinorhabdus limnophila]MCM0032419.1 DUF4010 domain-containing protein [Sandarakinorhabdus limnophila]
MLSNADLARLVMPLAIGLLIGLERGWQQRSARPGSRVAGLRTFGLFGLIGGLAGFAAGMTQGWAVSAVLLLAGCALVIIGYRRDKSPSATTEAAALVTLGLGWLAGHGLPVPALALAVVTAFLLAQRQRLHGWIEGLSEADFHAVVLFAVIAGALWPVLPDRAMGPMNAWNPRELWLVVVVVCAISFAGYVLGRRLGPERGVLAMAAVGAIYSSTAVTAALAQRIKTEPESRPRLAAGIAIASAVMFLRTGLLVGLLVPFALIGFARVVGPAALVALLLAWLLARRAAVAPAGDAPTGNPFALLPALGFAVLVALVQLVVQWMQVRFGGSGVAITLALAGAMDVDAAIVALRGLPRGSITPGLAGTILALPVLLNTLLKLGVVLVTAGRAGWRAGLSLVLAALAMLLGYAVVVPGLLP